MVVGYDRSSGSCRVDLTLNGDLVRRARTLTADLSATVERLLADFVEQSSIREAAREHDIDCHVAASNAFIAEHGTLADEFSTL